MTLRYRDAAAGLLCVLVLDGCERPAASDTFTERDSAGVVIALTTEPAWERGGGAPWSVASEPALDLARTGTGPEHEFYRVAGALRLSDGRIAVADGGSDQIRLYTPDGAFISAVGREGEGPGEFRQISGFERLPGDSLLVHDWPAHVTILAPDLELVRTFDLPPTAREISVLDDGTLVAELIYASVVEYEGGERLLRVPTPVVRFDPDGALRDTLAVAPGGEDYIAVTPTGGASVAPIFARNSVIVARDRAIYVGSSDSLSYRVLSPLGKVERIVRVPGYDLTLSGAEIEAERAAYLGANSPAWLRDLVERLPAPATRPAYGDLEVDPEGYVWAGEHQGVRARRALEARQWKVFAPNGEWLGSVELPARVRVLDIGVDELLVRVQDSLDVEHVQVLPLARGAP